MTDWYLLSLSNEFLFLIRSEAKNGSYESLWSSDPDQANVDGQLQFRQITDFHISAISVWYPLSTAFLDLRCHAICVLSEFKTNLPSVHQLTDGNSSMYIKSEHENQAGKGAKLRHFFRQTSRKIFSRYSLIWRTINGEDFQNGDPDSTETIVGGDSWPVTGG